jgi:hypothetical protein
MLPPPSQTCQLHVARTLVRRVILGCNLPAARCVPACRPRQAARAKPASSNPKTPRRGPQPAASALFPPSAPQVDRSAAYAARQAAKSVVASGLARRCLLQLAYSIGVAEPLSVHVDTYGTGAASDEQIAAAVMRGGR